MDNRDRALSLETVASATLCIICYERERDTTLSCGHSNVCTACIQRISAAAGTQPRCPTCRAPLDLPPALRRPGLQPVRFARSPNDLQRRTRSNLTSASVSRTTSAHVRTQSIGGARFSRRRSALGAMSTTASASLSATSTTSASGSASASMPPPTTGARVVVLAQRGVAVDDVCARLRRQRVMATDAESPPQYVWVTASGGAADSAVATRVHQLAPTVLVLAFDVAKLRSFDAVLRWDIAVPRRLPRVWAALSGGVANGAGGRSPSALGMIDVQNAAHCLGSRRTTVLIRQRHRDADAKRLADAVIRCFSPKPPLPTSNHGTSFSVRSKSWFAQCL